LPQQKLNWNPIEKLKQLKQYKSVVTLNNELSSDKVTVIDAAVNAEPYTDLVVEELKVKAESVSAEQYMEQMQGKERINERVLQQMKREMEKSIANAESQLDAMLATLTAEGRYRIWISSQSGLPQKMQVITELNYKLEQQERTETIQLDYVFKEAAV
jgi:hypothetical protein